MIDKNAVINIENAHIIFRNFRGEERGQYNHAGDRNFSVVIEDPDFAQEMLEDGWAVKVRLSFKRIPPKIVRIEGKHKTILDEDSIGCLDFDDISHVDLVIRPYNWEVNGKKGVAAYVKSMYVTVLEDQFASRYDEEDDIEE